jgi:hypothetical protein
VPEKCRGSTHLATAVQPAACLVTQVLFRCQPNLKSIRSPKTYRLDVPHFVTYVVAASQILI